ncbi:MBL fold metallo-hydrolase RNA specificity domain-containing protein [Litoribacter populi]|uniref:MBL fold metallo-hydrolase RNA specificity domain-containing protein n=1 Tax=Litoribacter populi TaxID=2598460 RepID=UPI00117DC43B|nr:MBL fold metallo-hydrolase [Litoribacter populi]
MDVRVKFLGGAKSVTGSRYLLEIDELRILVDCGLFQGLKELRERNWDEFPVDPSTIDMVLLTHAHIDHSGYLPKLVKGGFSGPIYATDATIAVAKILLKDAGKLQEEEADYARKKGFSRHEKPEPLFTIEDAERVFTLFQPVPFEKETKLAENVILKAFNAGHILGAAIFKLRLKGENQEKKIVFSGDLGRFLDPVMFPPVTLPHADVLFLESTYGNRTSISSKAEDQLGQAIRETFRNKGVALIPAFAVGRSQMVLYYLHRLQKKGKIPQIPIYIDSPMAIDVTKLYVDFPQYHKLGPFFDELGANPFQHKNLHYYTSQEASLTLNHIKGDAIIISASGMATGGRILHHLYNRLPNEQDSVIFVGYQAEGTRGRRLLNGESTVRMYGIDVQVKAKIHYVEGLSAHADQTELLEWLEGFTNKPKMTFLIHGEEEPAQALADKINEELGWQTVVPDYLESFELFKGI